MSSKRWWLFRIGLILGVTILVVLVGGATLMWCLNFFPDPVMKVTVNYEGKPKSLQTGQKFSLLSWNIQYAASRKYHFWYDGGDAVQVKEKDVHRTLSRLSDLISGKQPQILLLQEVDRNSARTHRIDQLPPLIKAAPVKCWASTTYHRSRFVPAPLSNPLGRVDMHLVNASTFKISSATRHALPQLDEIFIRRAFNLKRAVLETRIPIKGSKQPLVVMNTHLSAFSYGDGTLTKQIKLLVKLIKKLEKKKAPWILVGDFNMIPPGENPARLGGEAHYYAEKKNPLALLFNRYQTDVSPGTYKLNSHNYYTYLRFGAKKPDRKIDYIFTSKNIKIHQFQVLREETPSSDHLPLWMVASIQPTSE